VCHGGFDSHFEPQYDGDEEEQAKAMEEDKAEVQRQVDDALDTLQDMQDRGEYHKDVGNGFANAGYRHGGEGSASSTDWRAQLADYITRTGRDGDTDWSRIHRRRFMMYGTISPTRKGTLDRLAVEVDQSGSVDRVQLNQFMVEFAALLDLMQPSSGCLLMFANSRVTGVHEVFSGSDLLDIEVPCGGGTRMAVGLPRR